MPGDVKLTRDVDGILTFDFGAPEPTIKAAPGRAAPAMRSPRVVIDDSVTAGNDASRDLWGHVAQVLNASPPSPGSPAEIFTARAVGQPWFIKAEMVPQRGGRRVEGRVAKREPALVVTVRKGGKDDANAMLDQLGLSGTVVEQQPVRHGRGYGDAKRR